MADALDNPLLHLIDVLHRFDKELEPCCTADDSETRRESLKRWRQTTLPFWSRYRIPNEAFRGLCDPALAWLSNQGFREASFNEAVQEGAGAVVALATHSPIAMPHIYRNAAEAQSAWDRQSQLIQGVWAIKDRLRCILAQTGYVWSDPEIRQRVNESCTGDSHNRESPSPVEPQRDGPQPPNWLWWQGKQFPIGTGDSCRLWQLLNYMWNRQSATFQELQGPGRPWLKDVGEKTFSVTVNRVNNFLPRDYPRRLAILNYCVVWKTTANNRK